MSSLQKIFKENGIGAIVVILVVAYGVYYFSSYLTGKGSYGMERMDGTPNAAYSNGNAPSGNGMVLPSKESLGQNEVFADVNGVQTSSPDSPMLSASANINNPAELLPKDSNSQWAQLNPNGQGPFENNDGLLKAGYHIGIDSIGSSLRNANLQIRSEPPNPQVYVGPWNMSTITPDFMRPPLEIGNGGQ